MSDPQSKPKSISPGLILSGLVATAVLIGVLILSRKNPSATDVGQIRHLPDGSTLRLDRAVFTATNYSYSYQRGNKLVRLIAPILPQTFRNRLNLSSGSFGFGHDGNTNLFVISINRSSPGKRNFFSSSIARVRVLDAEGNVYDTCWGANTLGMQGETIHGWQIRSFPRRNRTITLQFFADLPGDIWTNAAQFQIPNPAYADYAQWIPEPWPTTKTNASLAVTLQEFVSGERMSGRRARGDDTTAARKTRLLFSFAQDGKPSNDWRVRKLTLTDATGNHWAPFLDFVEKDFNWAQGGEVEFFGALWRGENAWKLNAELVRTGGFHSEDLWEVPIPLPAVGSVATLTNVWNDDGKTVKLVAFASPNRDHAGDFKWIAKWWGADKNEVYSLALQVNGLAKGQRLSVVKALDDSGAETKIVQHGSQDDERQALFLKPAGAATTIRLTMALQKSAFVEFLVRPNFTHEKPITNQ